MKLDADGNDVALFDEHCGNADKPCMRPGCPCHDVQPGVYRPDLVTVHAAGAMQTPSPADWEKRAAEEREREWVKFQAEWREWEAERLYQGDRR